MLRNQEKIQSLEEYS